MATHMDASTRSRVVVFGSQGSARLLSESAVSNIDRDVGTSSSAAELLSRCHAAFLNECLALPSQTQRSLGLNPADFHDLRSFLAPQKKLQLNPVLQATHICLFQLISYLARFEESHADYSTFKHSISEAVGFCTGILPACVIASSATIADVINFGVEAVRFAFITACECSLYEQRLHGSSALYTQSCLVVQGITEDALKAKLSDSHYQSQRITISAVIGPTTFGVAGPHEDLQIFESLLDPPARSRFLSISGWYHGGPLFNSVAQSVKAKLDNRSVEFPTFENVQVPLRSSHDGYILDLSGTSHDSLARWALDHMLISPINWVETCRNVSSILTSESGSKNEWQLVSYGPSSDLMFSYFKDCTDLRLVDHSPFTTSNGTPKLDDIAIVGKAYQFPMAENDEQLEKMLNMGLSAVSEIPESRFDINETHDGSTASLLSTRYGAFLDNIWSFDNGYFNISPREAKSMDPQQRLLLHVAKDALEDAGYVPNSTPTFQKSSLGCFIGVATGDYVDNLRDNIDVFYSSGTLRAFHSGRISFANKLGGPSVTLDTACSSSTVSIFQACRALRNGDCTAAMAGGVNCITSPDMYAGLSRAHFLSPSGGCKPFDASADGYCRAEGCGIFVLKKLSDAIAENDQIHAVIRGVAVNHSGDAHSITHPHSGAQASLMNDVLNQAAVESGTVDVVEAHGTGTQAGDVVEMESLSKVFEKGSRPSKSLSISSIKGNIGHAEAASGAAGLAKLLLMMKNKSVYAQAGLKNLNPRITSSKEMVSSISTANKPWQSTTKHPRRALLNNFGASGSNASLLVEEYIPTDRDRNDSQRSSYIFNLSAKNRGALELLIERTRLTLGSRDESSHLADYCYTTSARREAFEYRVSLTCSSLEDVQSQLDRVDTKIIEPTKYSGPRVVFVFSGQGCIFKGMAAELLKTSPTFLAAIDACNEELQRLQFPSLVPFLSEDSHSEDLSQNSDPMSHCALVALEYALAKLLMHWNILPEYVVGHSLGEYTALAFSGALSLRDTFRIVAERSRLLSTHCDSNSSGMVALKASPEVADHQLNALGLEASLNVACRNSPNDTVVSGPLDAIDVLIPECSKQNIRATKLDVAFGFHSSAMDPILPDLDSLSSDVTMNVPQIPVFSTVYGRKITKGDLLNGYFSAHTRETVRFDEAMQSLDEEIDLSHAVCIEVGPHPTTTPAIDRIFKSKSCPTLSTLQKGQQNWVSLTKFLRQLFLMGMDINFREVFEGSNSRFIGMPGHPFIGTDFCVPYKPPAAPNDLKGQDQTVLRTTGYQLLPTVGYLDQTMDSFVFNTDMENIKPLISGHKVGGTTLCPASVYHELVLEAVKLTQKIDEGYEVAIRGMSFPHPLTLTTSASQLFIHLTVVNDGEILKMTASVSDSEHSEGTKYCTCVVRAFKPEDTRQFWTKESAMAKRQRFHLEQEQQGDAFHTKMLYDIIFRRVVEYGPEYHSIKHFRISESGMEGVGTFQLPHSSIANGYVINPVFTDTLLHAAGFVVNLRGGEEEMFVCAEVEASDTATGAVNFNAACGIYCCLYEIDTGTIIADSVALDESGRSIASMRGIRFKRLKKRSFQRSVDLANSSKSESPKKTAPKETAAKGGVESMHDTSQEKPVASEQHAEPEPSKVDIESVKAVVKRVMSEVSGQPEAKLTLDTDLHTLGVDSLMQIEMTGLLSNAFPGLTIDHNTIEECFTLQSLQDMIVGLAAPSTSSGPAIVGEGDPGSDRNVPDPPVKEETYVVTDVIPSDDSSSGTDSGDSYVNGNSDDAASLSEEVDFSPNTDKLQHITDNKTGSKFSQNNLVCLQNSTANSTPLCLVHDGSGQISPFSKISPLQRSLWGLADPLFASPDTHFSSITEMAQHYTHQILKAGFRSIILGGWSFGGVVAFEMGRHLLAAGVDVPGLILIDSPFPKDHQPLPNEVISHILQKQNSKLSASLEEEFRRCASLVGKYVPSSSNVKLNTVALHSQEVVDTQELCGVKYDWLSDPQAREEAISGWRKLVGGRLEVLKISGNHFEPFSPSNVEETSENIERACNMINSEF